MTNKIEMSQATKKRLENLIEEATVDCYDEHEQLAGLYTMIEEAVEVPFEAKVVGQSVNIVAFEQSDHGLFINAICKRDGKKYKAELSSIEWGTSFPEGFEWIEAYLEWARNY